MASWAARALRKRLSSSSLDYFVHRNPAPLGQVCRFYSGAPYAMTWHMNVARSRWRPFVGTSSVQHVFPSIVSGVELGRGYATNSRKVNIGDRARQLQARRLWTLALGGSLVAGFVIVVLNTFQENLMFYVTPSQVMEKFFADPSKNKFRLGGLVLEGSVQHFKNSAEMEFVVTDLVNEILVRYRGALPDLFREGHSVVAEGFIRPMSAYPNNPASSPDFRSTITEKAMQSGCYFIATEVLAKHDEKYMPKEVAAAVEKNRAMLEGQAAVATMEEAPAAVSAVKEVPPSYAPPPAGTKKKGVAQAPAVAQTYEIK